MGLVAPFPQSVFAFRGCRGRFPWVRLAVFLLQGELPSPSPLPTCSLSASRVLLELLHVDQPTAGLSHGQGCQGKYLG